MGILRYTSLVQHKNKSHATKVYSPNFGSICPEARADVKSPNAVNPTDRIGALYIYSNTTNRQF